MPLAIRLGRARRRAITRRALLGRGVGTASAAFVDAWSGAPEPALAGGPSPVAPASVAPASVAPASVAPASVGPASSGRSSAGALVVGPLPQGDVPPADEGVPAGRLRRCTFRRLDPVGSPLRGVGATYAVVCLYAGAAAPEPLGDLASAGVACGVCTNSGIFRPDEA
jgi:hypothetical protein